MTTTAAMTSRSGFDAFGDSFTDGLLPLPISCSAIMLIVIFLSFEVDPL